MMCSTLAIGQIQPADILPCLDPSTSLAWSLRTTPCAKVPFQFPASAKCPCSLLPAWKRNVLLSLKHFTFKIQIWFPQVKDFLPWKIRQHLIDWTVGDVFVDRVSGLSKREGQIVAHSQQLAEADQPFVTLKNWYKTVNCLWGCEWLVNFRVYSSTDNLQSDRVFVILTLQSQVTCF